MIPRRGFLVPLLAVAVLLALYVRARAAEAKPEARIPCWVVNAAVATHGEEGAVRQARARGASEAQIREARRCLK